MKKSFKILLLRTIALMLLTFVALMHSHAAAPDPKSDLAKRIDTLLTNATDHPFNGIVHISQAGKTLYTRSLGYADMLQKTPFPAHPQFVIGSVSKQITAVLVLRLCAAGLVTLYTPIRAYLPTLPQPWADTVTIHHLLNHTSGYEGRDKPLAFRPGAKFSYSNQAYGLLGDILAKVTGMPYETLAAALFKYCKMRHTTTPKQLTHGYLLTGFSRQTDGRILPDSTSLKGNFVPAAQIISTPGDIARWNEFLHANRRLLPTEYYTQMIAPTSKRPHPIFGEVDYGYGVQTTLRDGIFEISHGGYVPGFVSVNFYYPATKTSLVVMENLDWMDPAFQESFHFEMEIRRILRESGLLGR
jgi:D-alanyl-D-alanine carboxypeptidase